MLRKLMLFVAGIAFPAFTGCNSSSQQEETGTSPIGVSWKLVSNFIGPANVFEAKFKLVNHGRQELDASNWALFFNMSPREIHPNKTPQPAVLKHINGDWYTMVPAADFRLAPGDSVEIYYQGTEGIVKETDAPLGLYFVHYDQDGQETGIAQVSNYTIEPFTEREQLLRGEDDRLPAASAENTYRRNNGMEPVAADNFQTIVPAPVTFRLLSGQFELQEGLTIAHGEGLAEEAAFLREKLEAIAGISARVRPGTEQPAAIRLDVGAVKVNGIAEEAYRLDIGEGVTITGSDPAGVFYGIQSLLALIPVETWQQKNKTAVLSRAHMEDAPRFHFRSMHLDVSRNFQSKESVLRVIDLLAFYKINHLLLYVTEDEGWRVEIEGLPELTQVGGQRGHVSGKEATGLHPAYGSGPVPNEPGKHGSGYYTRADFVEILKYARQRHITIIPELNFPGHARAAIKAMEFRYERLMKEGDQEGAEEYRLIDPDDRSEYLSAQFYTDNVVSVARESTYRFFEKVVDTYMDMYEEAGLTLKKFHTGGDEVAEGAWTKSPLAARLLADNPAIRDPKNLHIYFFRKLLPLLKQRGLEVHGWEEVALEKDANGVYVPNPEFVGKGVVPYIWNNLYDLDLGYRLANAGYPVVLCNVTNFYFDLAPDNDPREPGLYWGGFVNARTNWEFSPYNFFQTTFTTSMGEPLDFSKVVHLRPDARRNIIGIESQLWSETVKGREMMEYYILPKLIGFAESAWSERSWETIANPVVRKNATAAAWNVFANRLSQVELPRLNYMNGGYNYRLPAPGAVVENGELKANSALPGLAIHYTTDGSEPDQQAPLYEKPVTVKPGKISLKAFDKTGKSSLRTDLTTR